MRACLHIIFSFGFIVQLFAQSRVTIQIIDADTDRGISQIGVELLGLGSGVTDSDGMVRISIPPGTNTVELQAPKGYKVLTPPGPVQPVPNSEEVLVKFWLDIGALKVLQQEIRRLSNRQESLESVLDSVKEANTTLQTQVASMETANRSQVEALKIEQLAIIDSLQKSLVQVQSEIAETKLSIYRDISQNYNSFYDAIANFTEGLRHAKYAFISMPDVELLNAYRDKLSEARDDMHENYLGYIETVEQYWSKDLAQELEGLYDLALEKSYWDQVIPLNTYLFEEIDKAWKNEKPRILAQKRAKKPTKESQNNLRALLPQLESQAEQVLKKLKEG